MSEVLRRYVVIQGSARALQWAAEVIADPDAARAVRWLWPRTIVGDGGSVSLTTAIILALPRLDGLEVLETTTPSPMLQPSFFAAVGAMPKLQQLTLCGHDGATESVSTLVPLFGIGISETLTTLELDDMALTGPVGVLPALPALVEARFDDSSIALVQMVAAAAPGLRILRMCDSVGAGVDAWLGVLEAAPSLVVVDCNWVLGAGHDEDDHERMHELRTALFGLASLQGLILYEVCPDDSWASLFGALDDEIELDALAVLSVDSIDRAGIAALMELIEVSESLTKLSVDDDSMGTVTDILEVRQARLTQLIVQRQCDRHGVEICLYGEIDELIASALEAAEVRGRRGLPLIAQNASSRSSSSAASVASAGSLG